MNIDYETAREFIENDTCRLEEFSDIEICSEEDLYEALDVLDGASEDEVINFAERNLKV